MCAHLLIAEGDPDMLAWTRTAPVGSRVVVAINRSGKSRRLRIDFSAYRSDSLRPA